MHTTHWSPEILQNKIKNIQKNCFWRCRKDKRRLCRQRKPNKNIYQTTAHSPDNENDEKIIFSVRRQAKLWSPATSKTAQKPSKMSFFDIYSIGVARDAHPSHSTNEIMIDEIFGLRDSRCVFTQSQREERSSAISRCISSIWSKSSICYTFGFQVKKKRDRSLPLASKRWVHTWRFGGLTTHWDQKTSFW